MTQRIADGSRAAHPKLFAHVVLRTARLEAMKSWWCTVLQAHVVFANPGIAFLTYDEEHHRVALVHVPGLVDPVESAAGLEHVAYTYTSLDDLLDTYVRLSREEIRPFWCINHGPTTSLYYRDPDGNRVELQVDNFPDRASLETWFRSGAFRKNPIGVNFEPEELLARYRAGEPLVELLQQRSA